MKNGAFGVCLKGDKLSARHISCIPWFKYSCAQVTLLQRVSSPHFALEVQALLLGGHTTPKKTNNLYRLNSPKRRAWRGSHDGWQLEVSYAEKSDVAI